MYVASMFFWRKLYVNDFCCILLKNPYIVNAKLFLVLALKIILWSLETQSVQVLTSQTAFRAIPVALEMHEV